MGEIPKNPEVKEKKTKLDGLLPEELIPPAFAFLPEVYGNIKAVTNNRHGLIGYIIADEAKVPIQHILKKFKFFPDSELLQKLEQPRNPNLYQRPLAHGSISEMSPTILFNSIFEINPSLHGHGAGSALHDQIVDIAKKRGYSFIAGYQNNAKIARFFLKRGRYLLEEIKDEHQPEFQCLRDLESDETVYYTINFLNHEDISKYIKPERLHTSVEEKITFKKKIISLHTIFFHIENMLNTVQEEQNDRATLIEIVEDLNQILPQNDRYPLPELHEDNENIAPILREAFEHLKKKLDVLAREATMEQLTSNIV